MDRVAEEPRRSTEHERKIPSFRIPVRKKFAQSTSYGSWDEGFTLGALDEFIIAEKITQAVQSCVV